MTGDLLKDTQGKVELSPKSQKIEHIYTNDFLRLPEHKP